MKVKPLKGRYVAQQGKIAVIANTRHIATVRCARLWLQVNGLPVGISDKTGIRTQTLTNNREAI